MNIELEWTTAHDESLAAIKEMLMSSKVLAFPDTEKPFILYTDASKFAMSAVLLQEDKEGQKRPIGYWSKSFAGSQLNWSALVKEARAVFEAVHHYAVYIKGCKTTSVL